MQQQDSTYFKPQIDWWVFLIVMSYLLFLMVAIPFVFWYGEVSLYVSLPVALFLALSAIFLIDKVFFLVYELSSHELKLQTHLKLFRVPYRAMDKISLGGVVGLFSFGSQYRFALSRKNISITIRSKGIRKISLSPEDREGFLKELVDRIDAERSSRAVRNKAQSPHSAPRKA